MMIGKVLLVLLLLSYSKAQDNGPRKIIAPGYALFLDGERDFFYMESRSFANVLNATLSAWIHVDTKRAGADYFDSYDMHIIGHPYARGSRLSLVQRQNQTRLLIFHRAWSEMYTVNCTYLSAAYDLNDASWHHVAMIVNKDEMKGFVDTKLVTHCTRVATDNFEHQESEIQQSEIVHLGQNNPEKVSNSRAFVGNIDEVMYISTDVSFAQLKSISQGVFPSSINKEDHLLFHSSFDKSLSTGIATSPRWKSMSGRSPRYEPSHATVLGGMLVSEARKVPTALGSPDMEIALNSVRSYSADIYSGFHYTIDLKDESYGGMFFLEVGSYIKLFDKKNFYSNDMNTIYVNHTHVPSGNATEEALGLTSVDLKHHVIKTNSTRIIYRPRKESVGKLTVNVTVQTTAFVQTLDVVFEVLQNYRPHAGTGGHAISCDGVDDFLFAKNFTWDVAKHRNGVVGGGPITVQFWALVSKFTSNDGAILSIGNGGDAADWMDGRDPYAKKGNFLIRSPTETSEVEVIVGTSSKIRASLKDSIGKWTHFTVVHEQASGNNATVFINGELVDEVWHDQIGLGQDRYNTSKSIHPISTNITGLSVCTWTFWSEVYHKGVIDELRIWNRTLEAAEIRNSMYVSGIRYLKEAVNVSGLKAYYTFDEPTNKYGVAKDSSGNNYHLFYGGCVPCEQGFMGYHPNPKVVKSECQCSPLVSEKCKDKCGKRVCLPSAKSTVSPKYAGKLVYGGHPCYYTEEDTIDHYKQRVRTSNWPKLISSTAPVRGPPDIQVAVPGHFIEIKLNATDPGGKGVPLIRKIKKFPKKGALYTKDETLVDPDDGKLEGSSVFYKPFEDAMGGWFVDYFSYTVWDGLLESTPTGIDIDIPCSAGQYFSSRGKNSTMRCVNCPAGKVQPQSGFESECIPCGANTFQDEEGQSSCKACGENEKAINATSCVSCDQVVTNDFLVGGGGCPVSLPYEEERYSAVLQILNDSHDNIKPVYMLTSVPRIGALYQFDGYENRSTDGKLVARKGNEIRLRTPGEIEYLYPKKVLDTCNVPVEEGNQENESKFGLLNKPDLRTYGESELAWGVCDRENANAHRSNNITLEFEKKVIITSVTLYENFIPGGVTRIEVYDDVRDQWNILWYNPSVEYRFKNEYRVFQIQDVCPNIVPSNRIRLTLSVRGGSKPSQLDGVRVTGVTSATDISAGTPVFDSLNRFVYEYPGNAPSSNEKLTYIKRFCTSSVERSTDDVSRYSISLGAKTDTLANSKKSAREVYLLLGVFVPIPLFLIVFMFWHNSNQKKKRKALRNKLDKARNTIPQSAIISSADVMIEHEIGRGAGGVVYAGTYRGMQVAIKQLSLSSCDATTAPADVKNLVEVEAKRMCELRHPNIVIFMGCCLEPDNSFIVSQYCERGSLYDILHNKTLELPWLCRLRLAVGATRGLMYLHSAKPPFIHRDIKSMNILVDDAWCAKLADFGTLRVTQVLAAGHAMEAKDLTMETGTVRWTAPEALLGQVMKGRGYPARAIRLLQCTPAIDVYSLGVVLWEIATRELPYNDIEFMYAVEEAVLGGRRLEVPIDGVPNGYKELVEQCLEWEPSRRPTTIELLQALEEMYGVEERAIIQSLPGKSSLQHVQQPPYQLRQRNRKKNSSSTSSSTTTLPSGSSIQQSKTVVTTNDYYQDHSL